ncbi:MAG: NAD(P)-dependent glycerol-3-phosphate dehydrogenase [Clostridia bacterium]|nr:NAD(P)-dependent glycerol-3-phosphate dehydrogenase [Clostridia bacterium]
MAKVSVLGAGGWGLALALTLYANHNEVTVWSPFENEVKELTERRTNERLLKGVVLPDEINITSDLNCVSGSAITVIATPSFAVRETAQKLREIKDFGVVVNVAKGLEKGSLKRLSQIISEELPEASVVVLSGPSHAEEVARKIPTMLTAASDDTESAVKVQKLFSNEFLRVYTNSDIIGVELGGALKNVIAVAAGLCDGMGLGDNSKAALITRGLAEMTRLGVAMGAQVSTFSGLTGLGDLIVTCTSKHSRNNRFGNLVGQGVSVEKALEEVGTVEGYYAAKMAYELSLMLGVYAPIITTCYELLYNGISTTDIVRELMTRPFKEE